MLPIWLPVGGAKEALDTVYSFHFGDPIVWV